MKYPFKTYAMSVEGHNFFVAESLYLTGCIGQGDSLDEAISELEDNEIEWLEDADEYKLEIPEIHYTAPQTYSKSFPLRLPNSLRAEAEEAAEIDGVSLNQFIVDAVRIKLTKKTIERIVRDVFYKTSSIYSGNLSSWVWDNGITTQPKVLERAH